MQRSVEASTTMRVAFTQVHKVLVEDPGAAFSATPTADTRAIRRFALDLGVDLGAGASIHQDVIVSLGAPRSADRVLVVPVEWHASGHEHLLPTFSGELEAAAAGDRTRLRLAGNYTVPLGVVGRFGDGVIGRRVARRSLESLVQRLAARLEATAHERVDAQTRHPGPRTVQFSDQPHPEIYVG